MLPSSETQKLDPKIIGAALLGFPQVEAKVVNHFGRGIYIREITIPAGSFIVGHEHKDGCMNVMLSGVAALIVDGVATKVQAPMIINAQPGAKMAYALTDVVWWNIHPNPDDETDLSILEDRYVNVPDWFKKHRDGLITTEEAMLIGLKEVQ